MIRTDNDPIPIKRISGLVARKAISIEFLAEANLVQAVAQNQDLTEQGGRVMQPTIFRERVRLLVGAKRIEISYDRLSEERRKFLAQFIDLSPRGRAYLDESGIQILFAFRGDVQATSLQFIETFNERDVVSVETLFINTNKSGLFGGATTLVFGSVYGQDFNNLSEGAVTTPQTTGGGGFLSSVIHIPYVFITAQSFNTGDGSQMDYASGWTLVDTTPSLLDFSV